MVMHSMQSSVQYVSERSMGAGSGGGGGGGGGGVVPALADH